MNNTNIKLIRRLHLLNQHCAINLIMNICDLYVSYFTKLQSIYASGVKIQVPVLLFSSDAFYTRLEGHLKRHKFSRANNYLHLSFYLSFTKYSAFSTIIVASPLNIFCIINRLKRKRTITHVMKK